MQSLTPEDSASNTAIRGAKLIAILTLPFYYVKISKKGRRAAVRYEIKSNKILIGVTELVAIARRGISTAAPLDENEPHSDAAERICRQLTDLIRSPLSMDFSVDGYSYSVNGEAMLDSEGQITIARTVSQNPERPRREEKEQIRGEGYLLSYLYAKERDATGVKIRFLYVSEAASECYEITEEASYKRLEGFFNKCKTQLSLYARPEIERVTERLPSLKKLKFPYKSVRGGQSEFIKNAYRTLSRGGKLYATAPTGTGKTVSALYPALRALGDERCEKVFYFTPKTTTANAARECLELMSKQGAKIKAVILSAKEKCCTEGHLCKRSKKLCKNAKCNNIANATLHLYDKNLTVVTLTEIRSIAKEYSVCPYELSLSYSEICDVVICDFNYLFDPRVYIRRFFDRGGRYAFLVDEAHNLSERVREGYSEEISEKYLASLSENPIIGELSLAKAASKEAARVFKNELFSYVREELRERRDGEMVGATHLSEVPSRLYSLFDELAAILEGEIFSSQRSSDDESEERLTVLRNYYYKIKSFCSVLARFDSTYKMFIFYEGGEIRAKLFCLDTGPIIKERLALGHGAVLFSATLSPLDYYRSILGGDRSDEMLEVNSPFDPSQLSVTIMDKISTRYSEREDTLLAVVRAIAAAISARRGNYMIFSPSFAYSEALASAFRRKYPKLDVISQKKDMSAAERAAFLDKFKEKSPSYLVGFCVMGGIYSEGVDLSGESLIGAVIVGIGIPSLSYEREAIQEYYAEKYEMGKEYAYIYPGMNRVFQAAGRVIRREDDRGIIVLIDDRFDDPIYKKSLPKLWEGVKFISDAKELREELDEFWSDCNKK